jgi:predicted Zn-dependent peptidase
MLLAQGNSSRLIKNVVEKRQKAVMAISFPFPLEDPGITINLAIANMGIDPAKVEKAIEDEIQLIQNELISDNELQKLRNMIESDFISSNSTMAGIAESLADYYAYQNNTGLINTELDRFMAVSKEDIQRVAKIYFVPNNRVVLYYLPKK